MPNEERLHTLRVNGKGSAKIICPFPEDSTMCGLTTENLNHEEDGCEYNQEGNDGCNASCGWFKDSGCAVDTIRLQHGLSIEDLGLVESSLPVDTDIPVTVKWETDSAPYLYEYYPQLTTKEQI